MFGTDQALVRPMPVADLSQESEPRDALQPTRESSSKQVSDNASR